MPWLLAIVVTSTPAERRASKAVGGARKLNAFGTGVPRAVTAVSRLTMARSAAERTGLIGPTAVAGSSASRAAVIWWNVVSPANAMVTDWGCGRPVGEGVAAAG